MIAEGAFIRRSRAEKVNRDLLYPCLFRDVSD